VLLSALAWASSLTQAATPPKPPPIAEKKALEEGRALAEQLRTQKPEEDAEFNGLLKNRDNRGKRASVPIRCRIIAGTSTWQAVYETVPPNPGDAEKLVVSHYENRPTEYLLQRGAGDTGQPAALPRAGANVAFANSDFWLADLGLDFIFWPEQRWVKSEMRRGRSCRVLESVNPRPKPGEYGRVLSWIDVETGGLLRAEAYDQQNKLLKEFNVGSFKKIAGQWQLHDMEIRNEQTDSRTQIVFDLEPAHR
jgi:hypothetical protein